MEYASVKKERIIELVALVESGTTLEKSILVCARAVVNYSACIEGYYHLNVGNIVAAQSVVLRVTTVTAKEVFNGIKKWIDIVYINSETDLED